VCPRCEAVYGLVAVLSSVHRIDDSLVDRDRLPWHVLERYHLEMLVGLASACLLTRVEVCEALIKSLHSQTHCLEIQQVQQLCLLLFLLRDNEYMVLSYWKFVKDQSVGRCEIVFYADSSLEWFQENVCLSEC